jgi:hypothetical protein
MPNVCVICQNYRELNLRDHHPIAVPFVLLRRSLSTIKSCSPQVRDGGVKKLIFKKLMDVVDKIFSSSDLLKITEPSDAIIDRLKSDFNLDIPQLADLIINKNAEHIQKNPEMLKALDYYDFENWDLILDNFIALWMGRGGKFTMDLNTAPKRFSTYIENTSCVTKLGTSRCKNNSQAVEAGHLACMSEEEYFGKDTIIAAASKNNLKIVKWLISRKCKVPSAALYHAAFGGSLEMLKCLVGGGGVLDSLVFCNALRADGDRDRREIQLWLLEKHCPMDTNTFVEAAKCGNLEIMKLMKDLGYSWEDDYSCSIFSAAAEGGNLDVMKWLHASECPNSVWTFARAARRGNIENMDWLLSIGSPFDASTFETAIYFGNYDVMEWCLANNFPADSTSFNAAVMNGDINLLNWLRERKFPWNRSIFANAKSDGKREIIEWLNANLTPETEVSR